MLINWNKNKIFASDEAWEEAKLVLISNVDSFEGMLKIFCDSIQSFEEFTLLKIQVDKSIEEVYCYPRRFIDIDINDETHKKMFNEALEIYNRIVNITNKYEMLIKDSRLKIESFLNDERLSYYQRYYEIIFNRLDHINEREDEYFRKYQIIRDEYQNLIANDLQYHTIQIDGEDIVIDEVNYNKYINHDNQEVRKSVSEAMSKTYQEKKMQIFSLYIKKLKNDIANAKAKNYESLKTMKLLENELPGNLIDKTISSVNKYLDVLHDYVSLKCELSGLEEYHSYDAGYKKITSEINEIDYEDAFKVVRDSLSFLGSEYLDYVDCLYTGGSIDLFPKKGKRNTNFTSITYAGIPYICLNYKESLEDVRTIAHEVGHAVHLLFSKACNKFEYFEFSLFITEVVAKVNERLFYRYFLDKTERHQDKLMILSSYINALGNSLFNQIMLTEFEDTLVNKLSCGEDISLEDANKIYESLLIKYNGESYKITENDKYGWLRINHYLLQESYYLYQYSIGTTLANIIYFKLILEKDYLEKYINFLSIGNKLNIIDSLRVLDIDFNDEGLFDSSMELMKKLIQEYHELSKKA